MCMILTVFSPTSVVMRIKDLNGTPTLTSLMPRCSALPVELLGQLGADHYVG